MVGVLDPLLGHLAGIELGKAAVEARVAVDDLECVVVHNLDLVVLRDIGEAHVLAVPLELAVQAVEASQAYGNHAHIDHLGEGA